MVSMEEECEIAKILKTALAVGGYQTFNENIGQWLSATLLATPFQADAWRLGLQKTMIDIAFLCVPYWPMPSKLRGHRHRHAFIL